MNIKTQFVPLFNFNEGYVHLYTFIVTNRLLEEHLKEVIEEETDKKVVTEKITNEVHVQNYTPRLIIYTATFYN